MRYLLAVASSQQGAAIVLATGRAVWHAGGFNGGDPVIDASKLAQRVAVGDVRYVLWRKGCDAGGAPGRNDTTEGIAAYLQAQCAVVPPAAWGGTAATPSGRSGEPGPLYRCGTGPPTPALRRAGFAVTALECSRETTHHFLQR